MWHKLQDSTVFGSYEVAGLGAPAAPVFNAAMLGGGAQAPAGGAVPAGWNPALGDGTFFQQSVNLMVYFSLAALGKQLDKAYWYAGAQNMIADSVGGRFSMKWSFGAASALPVLTAMVKQGYAALVAKASVIAGGDWNIVFTKYPTVVAALAKVGGTHALLSKLPSEVISAAQWAIASQGGGALPPGNVLSPGDMHHGQPVGVQPTVCPEGMVKNPQWRSEYGSNGGLTTKPECDALNALAAAAGKNVQFAWNPSTSMCTASGPDVPSMCVHSEPPPGPGGQTPSACPQGFVKNPAWTPDQDIRQMCLPAQGTVRPGAVPSGGTPSWVLPVAIGGGVLLLGTLWFMSRRRAAA